MKALEKAAKDRGEGRTEPAVAPAESRPELTLALELLAADTPSPRLREESRSEPPRQETGAGYYRGDAARAAAVVQASQEGPSGVVAYLRDRPVVLFGAAAGLFAVGFGIYVYLQVYHPGFFIARNPAPRVASAVATAPSVQPAATPQPIPAAQVTQAAAAPTRDFSAPDSPSELRPVPLRAESVPQAASALPPKPTVVRADERSESTPRSNIVIKRGDAAPSVNPALAEAYAALQGAQLDHAGRLYSRLLGAEPRNADALLGLAAIAVREGRSDDAAKYYRAILDIDPRHAIAQSGLIALTGRADPLAAESQLKTIIAREPSAYAYFTLGNLYADRSLWAQAQQAYFQAHHLEADNPDYAYNLAVGLEHLSQPGLAARFYRRALELASHRNQISFDPARARERIAALTSRAE